MKFKQIAKMAVVFMLVAAMVFCVSCGGNSGSGNNGGTNNGGGFSGSGSNDAVVDLNGYNFTVASPFLQNEPDMDILMISEQVFEVARQKVQKDYNCSIEIISFNPSPENMKAKVQSGAKIADIVHIAAAQLVSAFRTGLVVDYNTIEGIDVTDKRWVEGVTNVGSFAGATYGINCMRPSEVRNTVLYNRDLMKKFGVTDDIPQLVRDKKWTYDKFLEIAKKCTKDTNGDGEIDVYGYESAVARWETFGWIASNNSRVLTIDEEGYATETLNSPNTIAALNFAYELRNVHKVTPQKQFSATTTAFAEAFVKGTFAMMHCESWLCNQNIRKIAGDLDYGMIPMPLGPNATEYASNANNMLMFAITKTNKELDKTVPVFNALARECYNYGEEGWWEEETMIDYFQDGDTDSVEMYYTILDSSCIDYGAGVVALEEDIDKKITQNTIRGKKTTIAAIVNSLHGIYDENIKDIFNMR